MPARPGRALLGATLLRMARIFPVSNPALALAHYGRLGFPTREYADYATRAGVELHLGVVADRSLHGRASAYSGSTTQTRPQRNGRPPTSRCTSRRTRRGASTKVPGWTRTKT